MLVHCTQANIDDAYKVMAHLWQMGYSPEDIITSIFRVCKTESMPEFLKLEFIKVGRNVKTFLCLSYCSTICGAASRVFTRAV